MSDCISCNILAGGKRISPCDPIYEGPGWVVEHTYPVKIAGWLVLYPRRHVTALHELTADEYQELGDVLERLSRVLHLETGCPKEYLAFYNEQPGFHLHGHLLPRPKDLPEELRGPRSFALLAGASEQDTVPAAEVMALCSRLREKMSRADAVPVLT